jgi:putative hydrolase of the HAD superfamily
LTACTEARFGSTIAKVERFDLARHFDCICVEGELGWDKPDERVYVRALKSLNVEPQRVWMVGDNLEWDVAAPMRLGIGGIWYDRFKAGPPHGHEPAPSRIIRRLSELLDP